eukprot:1745965-Rhodomonas_salina.3
MSRLATDLGLEQPFSVRIVAHRQAREARMALAAHNALRDQRVQRARTKLIPRDVHRQAQSRRRPEPFQAADGVIEDVGEVFVAARENARIFGVEVEAGGKMARHGSNRGVPTAVLAEERRLRPQGAHTRLSGVSGEGERALKGFGRDVEAHCGAASQRSERCFSLLRARQHLRRLLLVVAPQLKEVAVDFHELLATSIGYVGVGYHKWQKACAVADCA